MMILCGQSNPAWHMMAGAYKWNPECFDDKRVGLLLGPSYFKKQALRPWMPYALDNDAFTLREKWSEAEWIRMLEWAMLQREKPMWVLVPDVVADRQATLARWRLYAPTAAARRWPLAFAVQDGMTPKDVPPEAALIFVGGSTEWKWRTVEMWADKFPRVHVGRVNAIEKVWFCEDLGVESIDGTGWFRDPQREDKLPMLLEWMENRRPIETRSLSLT